MYVYNNIIYKRGFFQVENQGEGTNEKNLSKKKIYLYIFGKEITLGAIFIIIILPIILSIIANILTNKFFSGSSPSLNINELSSRLDSVEVALTDLDKRLKTIEDESITSPINIDGDNNTINISSLLPIEDGLINTNSYSIEMDCLLSPPSWNSDDPILIDPSHNIEVLAREVENKKILVPYIIDNQERYFYGQFNENNKWNGNCIINVYENDVLQLIMDAEYLDGVLISYRQVNKTITSAGLNVWNFSYRTIEDNYCSGENWYYFRGDEEYIKTFDIGSVDDNDILNIENFEDIVKSASWLEGYYCGNTSNGQFNDEENQAFMIKYFKDQTVRTLYIGNFKDGNFYDHTGDAWYITKDIDTNYMYYKGYFDVHPIRNDGFIFEINLTLERIEEILKEHDFTINLNWNETFFIK